MPRRIRKSGIPRTAYAVLIPPGFRVSRCIARNDGTLASTSLHQSPYLPERVLARRLLGSFEAFHRIHKLPQIPRDDRTDEDHLR